jgi:hypothetical protein
MTWEPSFLAVGVLLGQPLGDMVSSLAGPLPAEAASLVLRLEASSRRARAEALAGALSEVAFAIEAARLA